MHMKWYCTIHMGNNTYVMRVYRRCMLSTTKGKNIIVQHSIYEYCIYMSIVCI